MVIVNQDLLNSGMNDKGLHNIRQLKMLGIKGIDFINWRKEIIGKAITDYQAEMFIKLKD